MGRKKSSERLNEILGIAIIFLKGGTDRLIAFSTEGL